MKKKGTKLLLGSLVCALGVGAFAVGNHSESRPAKEQLVNKESHLVVAEIVDNQVKFNDPLLQAQMKEMGIIIPPSEREKFDGKDVITLDDPDFVKAFKEYYVPANMQSDSFDWEEVESN